MKYYYYLSKHDKHEKKHEDEVEQPKHPMCTGHFKGYDRLKDVLMYPPATWAKYNSDSREDALHVIKMEYDELKEATSINDYYGTVENFIHLAAACMAAYDLMTCDEPSK